MLKQIFESLNKIDGLQELDAMVDARNRMRVLYAEMQTAYHATSNPLFHDYMLLLAGGGNQVNEAIHLWMDRAQALHAHGEAYAGGLQPSDPAI